METTQTSNERTPLIENAIISSEHRPLVGTPAIFNQQSLLYGNEATFKELSSPNGQGAVSNLNTRQVNCFPPRTFDMERNEVSLDEVTQALVSAWRHFRQPTEEVTLRFFNTKELYAMHLAWKKVTRGRFCYSENYRIAEVVAMTIAKEIHPNPPYPENDLRNNLWNLSFYAEKNLIAVNLLREWERITDGSGFPASYSHSIFEDSDEQPLSAIESGLRQAEMYEKIRDFILDPRFQICLHSLLFIWPICILIVGFKYLECPMSYHLAHLFMILGVVGCLAILFRLALIHVMSLTQDRSQWDWKWFGFRTVEFTFLIVFIIQAFHVFETDPRTRPDPNHCMENFYNTAVRINYVSIALVSAYASVYFIKYFIHPFVACHWIFRFLSRF